MDNYKIGDRVRIIRNTCFHSYKDGEIHRIHHTHMAIDGEGFVKSRYFFFPSNEQRCYVVCEDIELVYRRLMSKNIKVL